MTDDALDRLLKKRIQSAMPEPVQLSDDFSESVRQQLPESVSASTAYPRWLMMAYWLFAVLATALILYTTADASALSSAVITVSLLSIVSVVLLMGKLVGFRFSDVFQASLQAQSFAANRMLQLQCRAGQQ